MKRRGEGAAVKWLNDFRYVGRHRLHWPSDMYDLPTGTVFVDGMEYIERGTRLSKLVWWRHEGSGRRVIIWPDAMLSYVLTRQDHMY